MTIYRQDDPPLTAVAGDRFVDTNDENKLYQVSEDYTVATAADAFEFLAPAVATIVYSAKLPTVALLSASVHPSIPLEIAMRLAERVAANLAYSDEGANDKKVSNWNRLFQEAIKRAAVNRNSLTNPSDMRPG